MSDLIRREDVYDVLKKAIIAEMPIYVFDKLWNGIRDLPSVEPERKWIPVTEKLPEEEKDVLVSVHFDGYKSKIVNLPQSDYVEIANHIEGVWSSLSDEYKVVEVNHHVIAWMPLPEPWRGE